MRKSDDFMILFKKMLSLTNVHRHYGDEKVWASIRLLEGKEILYIKIQFCTIFGRKCKDRCGPNNEILK